MAKPKSDLSRAFSEDGARKTHVGGQALLEGWMYWPCVRGCRAMVESLVLGYKALEIAALHAFNEDEEDDADACSAAHPSACDPDGEAPAPGPDDATFSWKDDFGRPDTMIDALGAQRSLEVVSEPVPAPVASAAAASDPAAKSDGDAVFGKKEMAFSMVLGLVMGVVLFIVAPAFITNLLVGEYDAHTLAWNIVDGLLRVAVFVFYIWLIGRMSDIKRMFGYHGAEHKTIHCYEHGLPLTPENARQFPKVVLWPGMQMQYLTTNEPDDGMLECAIAAMQQVLEREELEAAKAAAAARGAQA